ncbi:MAG: radical SAM protein [Paludibacteraceae bacterium]|nr:radical SAM protein [Paludibacteraceae bacterium]
MKNMLFDSIVYGPIHSRRLGISLGVNLLPTTSKRCSFDCIYCECGFNPSADAEHGVMPTLAQVQDALRQALSSQTTTPDVITFSGNGEPTIHPDFIEIIRHTCALRDQYCPSAKVSVLSNSTQLYRPSVVEALRLCDNRILKLDSAIDATMRLIDQPVNPHLTVRDIVTSLQQFDGDFTLQTCFLRGQVPCSDSIIHVDNTTPDELSAWYKVVHELHPKQVMIYVIDRATPVQSLEKISPEQMQSIAAPLREEGIDVIVSA